MKKVLALVGLASTFLVGSVSAQSFAFVGEVDSLISSLGAPVDTTNGQGFYAVVDSALDIVVGDPLAPTPDEVASVIGLTTWTPLVDGTPAGGDWMTPGLETGAFISIAINTEKPLFAFFDDVANPSQVALIQGAPFASNLDNRVITIDSNNYDILVGQAGSLQMVNVVPEPSTYALLGGLFALGFVMWRRRRS